MKGFSIECRSEKGEEVLLEDLNSNKKIFEVVTIKEKPFLVVDFLFRRNPGGRMLKKTFEQVPATGLIKHLRDKLEDLGAKDLEDFKIEVVE